MTFCVRTHVLHGAEEAVTLIFVSFSLSTARAKREIFPFEADLNRDKSVVGRGALLKAARARREEGRLTKETAIRLTRFSRMKRIPAMESD